MNVCRIYLMYTRPDQLCEFCKCREAQVKLHDSSSNIYYYCNQCLVDLVAIDREEKVSLTQSN